MLGPKLEDLRSGDLRKAIRRGDKFVAKVVEQAAEYTGIAVANLINLLSPEVVVLGGGVMEALEDEMMPIIVETATKRALFGTAKGIESCRQNWGTKRGSWVARCWRGGRRNKGALRGSWTASKPHEMRNSDAVLDSADACRCLQSARALPTSRDSRTLREVRNGARTFLPSDAEAG